MSGNGENVIVKTFDMLYRTHFDDNKTADIVFVAICVRSDYIPRCQIRYAEIVHRPPG